MYDNLSPEEAARQAWIVVGRDPYTHQDAKRMVRVVMPLLARALDRMELDMGDNEKQRKEDLEKRNDAAQGPPKRPR